MKTVGWIGPVVILLAGVAPALASGIPRPFELDRLNHRLSGQVIDYTSNHGNDRRIWSAALAEKRNLYVYLPPRFDPNKRYPLIVWLHGFARDEHSFITRVVEDIDRAMACSKFPPAIVAAPDGSLCSRGFTFLSPGSFFLNSKAGNFEDFLMVDVWGFIHKHYPIRPEREAHVLAGVSMGGSGAFHASIKHRDRVGVAVGLMPPLNLRWVDCRGRYRTHFDPDCWGWRTDASHGNEVVGRFYGVFSIPLKVVVGPLFDLSDPGAINAVSQANPIEMLERLNVKPGELEMYVGYGGKDQFNLTAQVESYLYVAKQRGLCVGVGYEPNGTHTPWTTKRLLSGALEWLAPRLAPYAPQDERKE
jgi:S-formylglutathione hydrolase FrmB